MSQCPACRDPRLLVTFDGGGAHDGRHRRSERFFAADPQHRHGQRAFREEGAIVDRILVEGLELLETGVHGAGTCVEVCIMSRRGFVEILWIGREFVPEAVEVDTLPPFTRLSMSGPPKRKRHNSGFFRTSSHGPTPGNGASINTSFVTRSGILRGKGIGHHVADVMGDDICLSDVQRVQHGGDIAPWSSCHIRPRDSDRPIPRKSGTITMWSPTVCPRAAPTYRPFRRNHGAEPLPGHRRRP